MISNSNGKPSVGIYIQRYFGDKMTFVDRQLTGLSAYFDIHIFTPVVENDKSDVTFHIYSKEKNFPEKLYSGFSKKLLSKFTTLSLSQKKFWKDVITANGIKLIHAHFGPSGIQMFSLAKSLKLPLLVSFHGYDASKLLHNSIYRKNLRDLFSYAKIISASEYMKGKLVSAGADPGRINVLYYGIPVEQFSFIERKSPLLKCRENECIHFLQVANFQEKKGHGYTIKAFRKLLDYYSNCTLTLVGSGPLRKEIEELCLKEGIKDNVVFTGDQTIDEVKDHMARADIFLHHSVTSESGDQEGIPNAIIEAMATGLPTISTFHAGIPELIEDGLNGFLVEEKDVEGYYRKLKDILSVNEQMGLNASNTVSEKFNLALQVQKLRDIYSNLIK